MCPACEGPQYLFDGCCFRSDCPDPHAFRVDTGCIHCGHPLNCGRIEGFDVEAGKKQHRCTGEYPCDKFLCSHWECAQEAAREQYEDEDWPE